MPRREAAGAQPVTSDWAYNVFRYGALLGVLGLSIAYSLDSVPGMAISGTVLFLVFLWGSVIRGEQDVEARKAFEEKYAAMNDTQKVDYHLDRARRYGTNHDANIAQALLERNRK